VKYRVIGEGGLLNALNDVNYAINREAPDYVIVGEGRVLNFELVERAHLETALPEQELFAQEGAVQIVTTL